MEQEKEIPKGLLIELKILEESLIKQIKDFGDKYTVGAVPFIDPDTKELKLLMVVDFAMLTY